MTAEESHTHSDVRRDQGPHYSRYTLSFVGEDASLEEDFQTYRNATSLPYIRFVMLLAVVLVASFGLLDAVIVPREKYFNWMIRFGILCPGSLLLVLFTYIPRVDRYLPFAMVGMLVTTAAGFTAMMIHNGSPANYLYYAGLIQVIMYGYTLVRLRFIWGTLAGLILVVFYWIAAASIVRMDPAFLLNNLFFLLSSNLIGMVASYMIELSARRDYYMMRKLEQEREKVRMMNTQLESRVEERTRELVRSHTDLHEEMQRRITAQNERLEMERRMHRSQKLESLGVLAGGIAHDFNNILTAVLGNAELARWNSHDAGKVQSHVERIESAAERARKLVEQILMFSSRKMGEPRPLIVSEIIREAMTLMRPTISPSIEIRMELHPDTPMIVADPTQIHQVVINLCTNAFHAMEEHGGVMKISETVIESAGESRNGEFLTPGRYVSLAVADTGCGISDQARTRIFEPFFTTKAQGKGTGLGLSVVLGIVRSLGGIIDVRSIVGAGTTFEILLPLHEGPLEPRLERRSAKPSRLHGLRVLVVDDQSENVDMAGEMLELLGVSVVTCYDPVEACTVFRNKPSDVDLVLTDLTMPGMTGVQLAHLINGIRPGTPVLLFTGYREIEKETDLRAAGIRTILSKPFTAVELEEAILRSLHPAEQN